MPPALPPPQSGAISFDVLAEIAVGSTARVDLARARDLTHAGRLLAVKRLLPHVAEDPAFATEFLDEVWLTAALHSPNVVEVVGWGTDDEGAFLAFELVQGVSLARLMKTVFDTGEVFTERMVVFVSLCLCRGLAAAHALQAPNGELLALVHRDLTPGNVLTSFTGDVKIADFGIAKAKQRMTRTLTGLLKGQPQYMAPELARGERFDGRADLFSLAVVMFELFAGRRPWVGASDFEVVQATAKDAPPDLRELRPKIDKELAAIVAKGLEKDPARRFQSAREVEERLARWLTLHGYSDGNEEALARFVRRNAMRQMRWFERAVTGELRGDAQRPSFAPPPPPTQAQAPKRTEPTSMGQKPLPPRIAALAREDRTDVDAIRSKGAPGAPPPAIEDPPSDAPTHPVALKKGGPKEADVDWGEEVPTLVHKRTGQFARLGTVRAGAKLPAPRAKARSVPDRPFESIVEDEVESDPDMRATTVKRRVEVKLPGPAKALADRARVPPKTQEMPRIHEEEEQPTTPVQRGMVEAARRRVAAGRGFEDSLVADEPELGATVPQKSGGAGARGFVMEAERMGALANDLADEVARLEELGRRTRRALEIAQRASELAAQAAAAARAGRLDDAVTKLADARAREGEARKLDPRPQKEEPAPVAQADAPAPQPSAPLPLVVRTDAAPASAPPHGPPTAPLPPEVGAARTPVAATASPLRAAEQPLAAPRPSSTLAASSLDPMAFSARLRPSFLGLSSSQTALAVCAAVLLLVLLAYALLS